MTKVTPAGQIVPLGRDYYDRQNLEHINHTPGITVDHESNIYVADYSSVFKITADGTKTTLIAGGDTGGRALSSNDPSEAQLDRPKGIAVDPKGNIYIADTHNSRVLKIANNKISVFVGDDELTSPVSIVLDNENNLFIADNYRHYILKVTEDAKVSAKITTGRWTAKSLTVDAQGNLYVFLRDKSSNALAPQDRAKIMKIGIAKSAKSLSLALEPYPGDLSRWLYGIKISPDGSSLYATDDLHKAVHEFRLGFPYYGDHIDNTPTSIQTTLRRYKLALGGVMFAAGVSTVGFYLANSIADIYNNPDVPSLDHWNPTAEGWLPHWLQSISSS